MFHIPPTVFVISEDPALQRSLESITCNAALQLQTFESAEDFVSHPASAPGCVVLDLARPRCEDFGLQRRLAASRGDLPIIVVTAQANVPMAVGAMKAGAFEFFGKPFRSDLLLTAIRHAIERSYTVLRHEAEMSLLRDRYGSLSHRERQVMAGVVLGRLNKQVGGELGISEITVKAHRSKVMRKMGASSLPELVRMTERLAARSHVFSAEPRHQATP